MRRYNCDCSWDSVSFTDSLIQGWSKPSANYKESWCALKPGALTWQEASTHCSRSSENNPDAYGNARIKRQDSFRVSSCDFVDRLSVHNKRSTKSHELT